MGFLDKVKEQATAAAAATKEAASKAQSKLDEIILNQRRRPGNHRLTV